MRCSNSWLTIGAVMAGLAVTCGAFGAHGFDSYFTKKYAGMTWTVAGDEMTLAHKYLDDYKTGVRYHMWHAVGLIAVGLLSAVRPKKSLQMAGWSFLLGIVLFSGSLYALTISGQSWWGMTAPIGGALFIVGWIALAMAACPCGKSINGAEAPQPSTA